MAIGNKTVEYFVKTKTNGSLWYVCLGIFYEQNQIKEKDVFPKKKTFDFESYTTIKPDKLAVKSVNAFSYKLLKYEALVVKPLEDYHRIMLQQKKYEDNNKKTKEFVVTALEITGSAVSLASIFIPYFRIGRIGITFVKDILIRTELSIGLEKAVVISEVLLETGKFLLSDDQKQFLLESTKDKIIELFIDKGFDLFLPLYVGNIKKELMVFGMKEVTTDIISKKITKVNLGSYKLTFDKEAGNQINNQSKTDIILEQIHVFRYEYDKEYKLEFDKNIENSKIPLSVPTNQISIQPEQPLKKPAVDWKPDDDWYEKLHGIKK